MKLVTTLLMALPAIASIVGLLWLSKRRKRRPSSSSAEANQVDSVSLVGLPEADKSHSSTEEDFQTHSLSSQDKLLLQCESLQEKTTTVVLKNAHLPDSLITPNTSQSHHKLHAKKNNEIQCDIEYQNLNKSIDIRNNLSDNSIQLYPKFEKVKHSGLTDQSVDKAFSIEDKGPIEVAHGTAIGFGCGSKRAVCYDSEFEDKYSGEKNKEEHKNDCFKTNYETNNLLDKSHLEYSKIDIINNNLTDKIDTNESKNIIYNLNLNDVDLKSNDLTISNRNSDLNDASKSSQNQVMLDISKDKPLNFEVGVKEDEHISNNSFDGSESGVGEQDASIIKDVSGGGVGIQSDSFTARSENGLSSETCQSSFEMIDSVDNKDTTDGDLRGEYTRKDWSDMMDEEMEGEGKERKKKQQKRRSYEAERNKLHSKRPPQDRLPSSKSPKKAVVGNNGVEKYSPKRAFDTKSPLKLVSSGVCNVEMKDGVDSFKSDKEHDRDNDNEGNENANNNNRLDGDTDTRAPMNPHWNEDYDDVTTSALEELGVYGGVEEVVDGEQEKSCVESRQNLDSGLDSATSHSSPQQVASIETTLSNGSGLGVAEDGTLGDYYFWFPGNLCGLLIGRQGKNIKQLCEDSGAAITVDLKADSTLSKASHQIVNITGTWVTIWKALELLKRKFPPSKFPEIDFSPLSQPTPPPSPFIEPNSNSLSLPSTGESVSVTVSMVNSPDHLFLHLPLHSCYVAPLALNSNINYFYSRATSRPQTALSLVLPQPTACNTLCIALVNSAFYRAVVVQAQEDESCLLKFVDFGGFNTVANHCIYKISDDFATVPFQSLECYLYNIQPLHGQCLFSEEARLYFEHLVSGSEGGLLEACVVGYDPSDGVPYIQLFCIRGEVMEDVVTKMVQSGHALTAPVDAPFSFHLDTPI